MKKQYYLIVLILVTAVCFCSQNENSLKACGTSAAACKAINIKNAKDVSANYIEDMDASFNMFMNPFVQL